MNIYWDREEFKNLRDTDLERFDKMFHQLNGRGIENKDIGKYLYYIGDEMKLPGFVPNPLRPKKNPTN